MKTFLTAEQFVQLFWDKFSSLMARESYPAKTTVDEIVWSMFQAYEKDVKETLEGSMWGIDEYTGENASSLIGYQFQKSFRQTDVIPAKHIDGIIWVCLGDSPMFWLAMDRACKILVSEDAAKIYAEEM